MGLLITTMDKVYFNTLNFGAILRFGYFLGGIGGGSEAVQKRPGWLYAPKTPPRPQSPSLPPVRGHWSLPVFSYLQPPLNVEPGERRRMEGVGCGGGSVVRLRGRRG